MRHVRAAPLRNAFTYRTYQWLVDLDALPRLPWWLRPLASFRSADHLGGAGRSIRENVDRFLAARGIDLAGGRVTMLANARVLGYVFNPLTVYWCHDAAGALRCVLAEVHNTYGQRHCYLLRTDERGRAEVTKEFYVSPFYPVDGRYRMSLPEPGDRLALTVDAAPSGRAAVRRQRARTPPRGHPGRAAGPGRPAPVVDGRGDAAASTAQGLKLYARGLPVAAGRRHARRRESNEPGHRCRAPQAAAWRPPAPGPAATRHRRGPVRWPDVAAVPAGGRAAVARLLCTGSRRGCGSG